MHAFAALVLWEAAPAAEWKLLQHKPFASRGSLPQRQAPTEARAHEGTPPQRQAQVMWEAAPAAEWKLLQHKPFASRGSLPRRLTPKRQTSTKASASHVGGRMHAFAAQADRSRGFNRS
ncbi:hypothetical protein B9Z31_13545 [Limnohabitans sp. G3-2]|nr:hypothetical protein B9Z31_13545 [Limnohabitans sp. G3-2]